MFCIYELYDSFFKSNCLDLIFTSHLEYVGKVDLCLVCRCYTTYMEDIFEEVVNKDSIQGQTFKTRCGDHILFLSCYLYLCLDLGSLEA